MSPAAVTCAERLEGFKKGRIKESEGKTANVAFLTKSRQRSDQRFLRQKITRHDATNRSLQEKP